MNNVVASRVNKGHPLMILLLRHMNRHMIIQLYIERYNRVDCYLQIQKNEIKNKKQSSCSPWIDIPQQN